MFSSVNRLQIIMHKSDTESRIKDNVKVFSLFIYKKENKSVSTSFVEFVRLFRDIFYLSLEILTLHLLFTGRHHKTLVI